VFCYFTTILPDTRCDFAGGSGFRFQEQIISRLICYKYFIKEWEYILHKSAIGIAMQIYMILQRKWFKKYSVVLFATGVLQVKFFV
jgi:hypothetical protein